MKTYRIFTLLVLFLLVGFSGFAQKRNERLGPAAKNYKVWESEKQLSLATLVSGKEQNTLPNKNRIAIRKDAPVQLVARKEKDTRKGLRSKNRNPWRD